MLEGKANTEVAQQTQFLADLNFPQCYIIEY